MFSFYDLIIFTLAVYVSTHVFLTIKSYFEKITKKIDDVIDSIVSISDDFHHISRNVERTTNSIVTVCESNTEISKRLSMYVLIVVVICCLQYFRNNYYNITRMLPRIDSNDLMQLFPRIMNIISAFSRNNSQPVDDIIRNVALELLNLNSTLRAQNASNPSRIVNNNNVYYNPDGDSDSDSETEIEVSNEQNSNNESNSNTEIVVVE